MRHLTWITVQRHTTSTDRSAAETALSPMLQQHYFDANNVEKMHRPKPKSHYSLVLISDKNSSIFEVYTVLMQKGKGIGIDI